MIMVFSRSALYSCSVPKHLNTLATHNIMWVVKGKKLSLLHHVIPKESTPVSAAKIQFIYITPVS